MRTMQPSKPTRQLGSEFKKSLHDLEQKPDLGLEQLWADAKVVMHRSDI
jgi:hypothetical protein